MFRNKFKEFDVDPGDSSGEWVAVPRTPFTDFGLLMLSSLVALVAGVFLGWLILG